MKRAIWKLPDQIVQILLANKSYEAIAGLWACLVREACAPEVLYAGVKRNAARRRKVFGEALHALLGLSGNEKNLPWRRFKTSMACNARGRHCRPVNLDVTGILTRGRSLLLRLWDAGKLFWLLAE